MSKTFERFLVSSISIAIVWVSQITLLDAWSSSVIVFWSAILFSFFGLTLWIDWVANSSKWCRWPTHNFQNHAIPNNINNYWWVGLFSVVFCFEANNAIILKYLSKMWGGTEWGDCLRSLLMFHPTYREGSFWHVEIFGCDTFILKYICHAVARFT